mgnify:CR=1 FL=1
MSQVMAKMRGEVVNLDFVYDMEKIKLMGADLINQVTAGDDFTRSAIRFSSLIKYPPLPVDWLIENVMGTKGVVVFAADSTAGKTWAMLQLTLARIYGTKWMNHYKTSSGKTLYLAYEERHEDLNRRMHKLINGHPELNNKSIKHDALLYPMPAGSLFSKSSDKSIDFLTQLARVCISESINLIIVDTLRQASGDADENNNTEMGLVLAQLTQLSNLINGAVIVTHHVPKGSGDAPTANYRGASSIRGNADGVLSIVAASKGQPEFVVDKLKQGKAAPNMAFNLAFNEEDTACTISVCEPSEVCFALTPDMLERLGDEFSQRHFEDICGKGRLARKCFVDGTLEKTAETSSRGKEKILWKFKG